MKGLLISIGKRLPSVFSKYSWAAYFFTLGLFLPIVFEYIHNWTSMVGSYPAYVWFAVLLYQFILSVCISLVLVGLLSLGANRWYRMLVLGLEVALILSVSVSALYIRKNFNLGMTEGVLANVYATDFSEAQQLVFNSNMREMVSMPILTIALSLLCSWAASRFGLRLRVNRRIGQYLGLGALGAVLFLWLLHSYTFRFERDENRNPKVRYWMMSEIGKLYWANVSYRWSSAEFARIRNEKRVVSIDGVDTARLPEHLVVIVGESHRKEYMHLYGYPLEDSPMLDALESGGNLVVYSNAVAPRFATRESVPESLTSHSLNGTEGGGNWYTHPSIAELLSCAGYYTRWISTQNSFGKENWSISTLALSCDSVAFLKLAHHPKRSRDRLHDEAVLSYLPCREKGRVASIIHLMGHHTDYATGYPKGFARFSPGDIPYKTRASEREVVAHYVNTTLYNDSVLASVMHYYAQEDALVIYFSDHAQALYDDTAHPSVMGHSKSYVGLRIPFFIYGSDRFIAQHPDLWQQILGAKDRLFVNDLFTQSICSLLGISSGYNPETENLWTAQDYDTSTIRYAHGLPYYRVDTVDALPSYLDWLRGRGLLEEPARDEAGSTPHASRP